MNWYRGRLESVRFGDTLARAMAKAVAPITGTVWKIQVKVGDEVQAGAVLVILESMKMEMPIEAEVAGRVSAIHVTEGQAIDEGEPLVTLD
jgi:acetyl-CoA carboxylase biotin carboxyl carrier protein